MHAWGQLDGIEWEGRVGYGYIIYPWPAAVQPGEEKQTNDEANQGGGGPSG